MRIAITGGIGSGKSFVCKRLNAHGIAIYDCDSEAKRMMHSSADIRSRLTELIGPDTYLDGHLNKAIVSAFLLASEKNKQAINNIVHPAVISDFHASGHGWMECAILYEAHLEQSVDKVVCVTAPLDVRIRRIMQRDGITEEKACDWVKSQMSQDEVAERADFVINNDGISDIDAQIEELLDKLNSQN